MDVADVKASYIAGHTHADTFSNFALNAKLSFKDDTILVEDKDSPYVNIVTVLKGRENEEKIQKLIKALQSEKVKKYIDEKYNGSVVAAF